MKRKNNYIYFSSFKTQQRKNQNTLNIAKARKKAIEDGLIAPTREEQYLITQRRILSNRTPKQLTKKESNSRRVRQKRYEMYRDGGELLPEVRRQRRAEEIRLKRVQLSPETNTIDSIDYTPETLDRLDKVVKKAQNKINIRSNIKKGLLGVGAIGALAGASYLGHRYLKNKNKK